MTLNKGISNESENTGTISVTNINPDDTSLLASTVRPQQFVYYLRASYGDVSPQLISEGHVSEITWRHEGGDVFIDFSISEGNKYLENNAYEIIGIPTVSGGASVFNFINGIRDRFNAESSRISRDSQTRIEPLKEFNFIGDREEVIKDLKNKKLSHSIRVENLKEDLADVLEEAGYRYFTNDRQITIMPLNIQDRRFVRSRSLFRTTLNFKTGLLNLSLENVMNYEYGHATRIEPLKEFNFCLLYTSPSPRD